MGKQLAINGGDKAITSTIPAWPIVGRREEEALLSVLHSGRWGRLEGESIVARFERRFAEAHGCQHGIACTSGSVALRLSLWAIGIQPGDEVIVPPFTFLATSTVVVEANGAPIFADIEPDTYNIDPEAIERAITPRTRAIIPVHMAGLPADMDAIMKIARRHNLYLIEDCCHAHGARYKERPVGSFGHIGCFSFQASKNMCSGEGGIMITNDGKLADLLFSIHNCGREPDQPWYRHFRLAGNYRMTEFQGAILDCQMDRLEEWCDRRDSNGRALAERVSAIPGLATQPMDRSYVTRHGFHLFIVRFDESVWGMSREVFVEVMRAEGLPLSPGYPLPLFRQPLFQDRAFGPYQGYKWQKPDIDLTAVDCPVTDHASDREAIWLSQRFLLGTPEQIDEYAAAFEKVYANRGELRETVKQEAGK